MHCPHRSPNDECIFFVETIGRGNAYVIEKVSNGKERTRQLFDRDIRLEEVNDAENFVEFRLIVVEVLAELNDQNSGANAKFVEGNSSDLMNELFGQRPLFLGMIVNQMNLIRRNLEGSSWYSARVYLVCRGQNLH